MVVDWKKKVNASRKRARHTLCNTIQSLGYTLNVKCSTSEKMNILLLKSLTCMLHIMKCRAPHVSMEAM